MSLGAHIDINWLVDRLVKLREFSSIILEARERKYLERSDAKRLVELLREFAYDYGDETSRGHLLKLLEAIEKAIVKRDSFLYRIAKKRFDRDDVVPIPEVVAEELPMVKLLELLNSLRRRLPFRGRAIGRVLEAFGGVDEELIDALNTVGIRDLIGSMGILFENFLRDISTYSMLLQKLIEQHGLELIDLNKVNIAKGDTLSILLEPVARSFLAITRGGTWEYAQPRLIFRGGRSYEFDAVALDHVNGRLYAAEIELTLSHDVVRKKVSNLKELYESYVEGARSIGLTNLCIENYLFTGFTKDRGNLNTIKNTLIDEVNKTLPTEAFCKNLDEAIEVLDLIQAIQDTNENKIPKERRQVYKRIVKAIGTIYKWWYESRAPKSRKSASQQTYRQP
ncbi:MAG: hypothetical protein DRO12_05875 [Thermoprotei archaeon]|nr:MAG: hypothetical protein DRO12_05875 [Thermoprotei archaeon]